MSSPTEPILVLQEVTKSFGGVRALDRLSMIVGSSDIFGLIGPNGAGKTTVFNIVTGVFPLTAGAIRFRGETITGMSPHRIVRLGIARTYQNIRLFESMTVYEHIVFAQNCHARPGMGDLIPLGASRERALREQAHEILNALDLWRVRNEPAISLPYGQQRRVEMGRALATRPRLLLLDEPSAGMNLAEKKEILDLLMRLNEEGLAIFVIEHDMRLVMNVCNRITVLNFGEKIAEGTPEEIRCDLRAKEVYLGKD